MSRTSPRPLRVPHCCVFVGRSGREIIGHDRIAS